MPRSSYISSYSPFRVRSVLTPYQVKRIALNRAKAQAQKRARAAHASRMVYTYRKIR